MFRQIPEVGFFEKKNQFFIFLSFENQFFSNVRGPKKFLWVLRPFLASRLMVLGGHTSIISWSEKISRANFDQKSTKNQCWYELLLEVWPPLTISVEAKYGLGTHRNFLGPLTIEKNWFSRLKKMKNWFFQKNLTSGICLNIGGGSYNGPCHPGTVGSQDSIRFT